MGGVGRAFAKLMLFGEHAAVYGHPAVGASLPEALTARLHGTVAKEWDLREIAAEDRDPVRGVLARLEKSVPGLADAGRCSLAIESSVPRGAGFGSSAALCGALALATLEHAGASITVSPRRDAWQHAHEAERLFHGTPSGVDTGLSLIGGMLAFRPRPPALPSFEDLSLAALWIVTAAVPRDEACGALIAALGQRMRAGEAAVRSAMEELGDIAQKAWDALKAPGPRVAAATIASLSDEAMHRLRGLGLSTPALDALLGAGKTAGAAGGKLSGAGGGGAFFLVAAGETAARAAADAVTSAAERHGITLTAPVRVLSLGGTPPA